MKIILNVYIQVIQNPLQGAISAGLFGRKLGVYGSILITTGQMFQSSIQTLFLYYEVAITGSPVSQDQGSWQSLGGLIEENWSFSFDSQTVSMLIPIIWISSMVHQYSMGYMGGDVHIQRFFSYLSLFTFSMIIQVTADNLLLLFAGWESVGLCSYLLINFWYTRIAANQAALKAFQMNRFGDWSLTLALQFGLALQGDISLHFLFSIGYLLNKNLIQIQTCQIQLGAIAKSAQFGLHTWQPQAMEGDKGILLVKIILFICLKDFFEISFSLIDLEPVTFFSFTPNLKVTDFQKKAITGLLLSDGSLSRPNGTGKTRLEFTFKADHKEFILWLKYSIQGSLCTSSPLTPYPKKNPTQYWFGTRSLKYLGEIYNDWYISTSDIDKKRKKILPVNIEELFTEVSQAYLLMGDGYWDDNRKTIYICTECFTQEEVNKLLFIQRHKQNLVCSSQKRGDIGFRIRFSSKALNIQKIQNLCTPYFHPLLLYKQGLKI